MATPNTTVCDIEKDFITQRAARYTMVDEGRKKGFSW
jgi:hypothetical protein